MHQLLLTCKIELSSVLRRHLLLLAFVVHGGLLTACNKDAAETDVPPPILQLIETYSEGNCNCEWYIDQYVWRSQTVYISSCRGAACQCMVLYYDAAGAPLEMDAGYSFDSFVQDAEFVKASWSCK